VLVLVLAAALSPSTVSYLGDGARFDYRPSLTRIKTDNPRGTVVIWPRVQAMWASPDLESIELRNTTPLSTFDSLLAVRDRFWVVTSQTALWSGRGRGRPEAAMARPSLRSRAERPASRATTSSST
jgi:hypothetical protein